MAKQLNDMALTISSDQIKSGQIQNEVLKSKVLSTIADHMNKNGANSAWEFGLVVKGKDAGNVVAGGMR